MKRYLVGATTGLILLIIIILGVFLVQKNKNIIPQQKINNQGNLLGNDRDEHGCIGTAGYVWDEKMQKCIRPWEKKKEDQKDNLNNAVKDKATENNAEKVKTISWYKPKPGISWQWQLDGPINTSYKVDLYDIDLFDVPQSVINSLHKRGVKVICYFSAGSWEDWRPDAGQFPKDVIGRKMEDWAGEKWLNVTQFQKFAGIMKKRMDLAVKKQCDGVEPDNVDGFSNKTGFNISPQDQLRYNKWLASEAHKRGLAVALKNDIEQVGQLVNYFDFAINEQCFEYDECSSLQSFIKQGKAVLGVEYELKKKKFCPQANAMNFSWLKMDYDLKGNRSSCR